MKNLFGMFLKYPISGLIRRAFFVLRGHMVTEHPKGTTRGHVLLSFTTLPFTLLDRKMLATHSNYWNARDIADTFLERGYSVDVIDFDDRAFIPKKTYSYFIDIGANIGRLAPLLPKDCVKIYYATGAYWEFQNTAEQARIEALRKRRGVRVLPRRQLDIPHEVERADIISGVCGSFPASTYERFKKPIHMVPVISTDEYAFDENKAYEKARDHFVWFGGVGAVHKGLDLVLEAFATMPEYTLTVCGKFEGEEDFVRIYKKELYETSHIHAVGFVSLDSPEFLRIMNNSIAVVSVSCSEGGGGSIITCMHAGLVPIVNKETGVTVEDFGIMLPDSSIVEIQKAVRDIASTEPERLRARARAAWNYARDHHSKIEAAKKLRAIIDDIESVKKAS